MSLILLFNGEIPETALAVAQEQALQEQAAFLVTTINVIIPSAPFDTTPVPKKKPARKAQVKTGLTITADMMKGREDVPAVLPVPRLRTDLAVRQVQKTNPREIILVAARRGRARVDLAVAQVQGVQPPETWKEASFEPRMEMPTIEAWIAKGEKWPSGRR